MVITETLRNETVAVAEDDSVLRNIVCSALEEQGYKTISAANGREILGQIQGMGDLGNYPNLLVTDLRMPVMTGFQLIDELDRLNIYMPVLVLTGYGDRDILIELIRKGCKDYLDKPFRIADLVLRVKDVLKKEEENKRRLCSVLESVEANKALPISESNDNSHLPLRIRTSADYKVFALQGNLEDSHAALLREAVDGAIEEGDRQILIDLSQVSFMCSFCMGVVIYLWKRLSGMNGTLYILSGETTIRKKIEELNLSRVIRIFPNEADFVEFRSVRTP